MYEDISERKKYVDDVIALSKKKVDSSPELILEIMSMCYVLASASIEYMVESILLTWTKEITKFHDNSGEYIYREYTQLFLKIKIDTIEVRLKKFQSSELGKIRDLLEEIAGDIAKGDFDKFIKSSTKKDSIDKSVVGSKLKDIIDYRHRIAHGGKTPKDEQPNLDQLKTDFNLIYKHLIENIKKALPLPQNTPPQKKSRLKF